MNSYEIYKQAEDLVRKLETRNVEQISKYLGISIYYEDSLKDLLGMYTFRWNHRIIILNSKMDEQLKLMVIAHELGHDQLHRDLAKAGQPLKEFGLFTIKDITEYEANAFAAHILLPNDEVYAYAIEDNDIIRMAQDMGVDHNLMLIKLQEMNRMGYNFNIPLQHDSTFFRKIETEKKLYFE